MVMLAFPCFAKIQYKSKNWESETGKKLFDVNSIELWNLNKRTVHCAFSFSWLISIEERLDLTWIVKKSMTEQRAFFFAERLTKVSPPDIWLALLSRHRHSTRHRSDKTSFYYRPHYDLIKSFSQGTTQPFSCLYNALWPFQLTLKYPSKCPQSF